MLQALMLCSRQPVQHHTMTLSYVQCIHGDETETCNIQCASTHGVQRPVLQTFVIQNPAEQNFVWRKPVAHNVVLQGKTWDWFAGPPCMLSPAVQEHDVLLNV